MIAIDLGSNTIRFLEFDCQNKQEKGAFEAIVRTAEGMHRTGVVGDAAVERIVAAIKEARSRLHFADPIAAVATAALRNAKNQEAVLQVLKEKSGIAFKVIDPQAEGYMTAIAVENCAKAYLDTKTALILDIGGASTELIFKDNKQTVAESFDLGIVIAAEKYGNHPEKLRRGIQPQLTAIREFLDDMKLVFRRPGSLLATAGTPTTLAALKLGMNHSSYDKAKVNGTLLTIRDIDTYYAKLSGLPEKDRERLVGVGRGDLILAGTLLLKEVLNTTRFGECYVFDDGLREGVALTGCSGELDSF